MFLEACFAYIAICLPSLSAILQMDLFSRFVEGLSSLFSRDRSRDSEAPWGEGHERIYSKPTVVATARQGSDVDHSMQSFEMHDAKAIKVTNDVEQTRSMV